LSGARVSADVLLRGSWFALEQCGFLLEHAVILHRAKVYPTAMALALFAREELGRCSILREFWKRAVEGGYSPSTEEIQAACDDHVEKQRLAQRSLTYRTDGTGQLDEILRKQMQHSPSSAEWREADEQLKEIDARKGKRTPADRHAARMKAIYVDLNESGSAWNRPIELNPTEATQCLEDAANDYAVLWDKFQPGMLRAMVEPKMAEALEAWDSRPPLPVPARP
jgi:AbiV family abortive infection protein